MIPNVDPTIHAEITIDGTTRTEPVLGWSTSGQPLVATGTQAGRGGQLCAAAVLDADYRLVRSSKPAETAQ